MKLPPRQHITDDDLRNAIDALDAIYVETGVWKLAGTRDRMQLELAHREQAEQSYIRMRAADRLAGMSADNFPPLFVA